jgi:hypothetical protein
MAHVGGGRYGYGRRPFVGGYDGYGVDCPYYGSYTWPYTCAY